MTLPRQGRGQQGGFSNIIMAHSSRPSAITHRGSSNRRSQRISRQGFPINCYLSPENFQEKQKNCRHNKLTSIKEMAQLVPPTAAPSLQIHFSARLLEPLRNGFLHPSISSLGRVTKNLLFDSKEEGAWGVVWGVFQQDR